MAEVAQRRLIQLVVDNRELVKNTAKTVQELEKTNKSFSSLNASVMLVQKAFIAFAALRGLQATLSPIIDATNDIIVSQQRLAAIVNDNSEIPIYFDQLVKSASSARVGYGDYIEVFTRFSQSLKGTGATIDQVDKLTQGLVASFRLSGSTAAEANANLIQLSQAFRSGVLQGDEFRTVSEGNGLLLRALAENMGVATGELKKMASEGKITASILADTVLKNTKEWNAEVEKLVPSLQDLWVEAKNVGAELLKEVGADTLLAYIAERLMFALKSVIPAFKVLKEYIRDIFRYMGSRATSDASLDELLKIDPKTIDSAVEAEAVYNRILETYNQLTQDADALKQRIQDYNVNEVGHSERLRQEMIDELETMTEKAVKLSGLLSEIKEIWRDFASKPLEINIVKPPEEPAKEKKVPKSVWSQYPFPEPKPSDVERLPAGWATGAGVFDSYGVKIKQAIDPAKEFKSVMEQIGKVAEYLASIDNPFADYVAGLETFMKGFETIRKDSDTTLESYQKMGVGISQVLSFVGEQAASIGVENATFQKALAIAQAAINSALAITKVLAEVAPPWSFALAGSIAAMTGAQMSVIANQSIPEKRQFGGPVTGGIPYRVGEAGPELYSDKYGRRYMIPGENGRVTPGAGKVIVNNYGNGKVETETASDGALIVTIVDQAVKSTRASLMREMATGQGDFNSAMQRFYGVRRM